MSVIVYKLTSPSGKSYIGYTTKTLQERFEGHCKNKKSHLYIVKAIRKYGPDSFITEEIDWTKTVEEAKIKEIYWIKYYDTNNPEKGYNMTKGGDGFDPESASIHRKNFYKTERGKEWIRELSRMMSENNPCKKGNIPWNVGIPMEEEVKKKVSNTLKEFWDDEDRKSEASEKFKKMWADGVYDNRPPISPEVRARIAESNRGKKQTDYQKQRASEANKGKPKTKEAIEKMRQTALNRPKTLCQYCNKMFDNSKFIPYHGDKCRQNPDRL